MAIDLLAKRDIMEVILPLSAAAAAISQTSGVGGAWSTSSQIIPATGTGSIPWPFILCGAYVLEVLYLTASGAAAAQLNLQIRTGAVGSEVLVAESAGVLIAYSSATSNVYAQTGRTHDFEPKLIPANTRLSMISTSTHATIPVYIGVYLFGYDARSFAQPLKYIDELRYIRGLCAPTQGAQMWPSGGATTVTAHATAGTYGTPVIFEAHADSPLLITGLLGMATNVHSHGRAQIGIGANPDEQWMSLVGLPGQINFVGPLCDCRLRRPLFVKTGEAVSVRTTVFDTSYPDMQIALRGCALK